MPTTPARAADLARALALVRPITRRRLYCTARAVLVSDPAQVAVFDAVFVAVFGRDRGARGAVRARRRADGHRADDDRPRVRPHVAARRGRRARVAGGLVVAGPRAATRTTTATRSRCRSRRASDEERLSAQELRRALAARAARSSTASCRACALATPLRRTRRHERGRHGQHIDMRRTLRRSLRTGGDPIRLARRRRRVVRRRLVMLCDISGSMEPYARAYLQFLTCAAGSGPNAEAFVFATRLTRLTRALASRRPERAIAAGGGGGARLVERDADRRRAQGVQRPPRPPRHGPRGGRS